MQFGLWQAAQIITALLLLILVCNAHYKLVEKARKQRVEDFKNKEAQKPIGRKIVTFIFNIVIVIAVWMMVLLFAAHLLGSFTLG